MYMVFPKGREKKTYQLSTCGTDTKYLEISHYICTLTKGCFNGLEKNDEEATCTFQAVFVKIGKEFAIHQECYERILMLMKEHNTLDLTSTSPQNSQPSLKEAKKWLNIGKLVLTEKERHILVSGQLLNDIHINAAQMLLKKQFSHINGLQCPQYQLSRPLVDCRNVIQILHLHNDITKKNNIDHWGVISTNGYGNDCEMTFQYYDSAYSTLQCNSEEIICHLLTTSSKCFRIKVNIMPTPKQSGSSDCGLYAIAIATALAYNLNPSSLIFAQSEMREHFLQCLLNRKLEPFPITKTKKPCPALKQVTCYSCPKCCKGDDGSIMVECDRCGLWYHEACVNEFDKRDKWYGPSCCNAIAKT